jgi:hypothetical protein
MHITQDSIKSAARRLSAFTKSTQPKGLSYNQALEALSRAWYNRSWSEVRTQLSQGHKASPESASPAAPAIDDPWWDNAKQFPRLIEEAQAAGAFTPEVLANMADSMDLSSIQIHGLLARALASWEDIKEGSPPIPNPLDEADWVVEMTSAEFGAERFPYDSREEALAGYDRLRAACKGNFPRVSRDFQLTATISPCEGEPLILLEQSLESYEPECA